MWLTLQDVVKLGICPQHYQRTSELLRILIAENTLIPQLGMHVFSDLKTGKPVLFFERCEVEKQNLVKTCCNLKAVDQHLNIGSITVKTFLKFLNIMTTTSDQS